MARKTWYAKMIPFFDGHNDLVMRLLMRPDSKRAIWLDGEARGHLDLPRMKQAGFAGGFFAIFLPSPASDGPNFLDPSLWTPPYQQPLPRALDFSLAQTLAEQAMDHLFWMESASNGDFRLCRSVSEINAAKAHGEIAGIVHMEGAEAIGPDLNELQGLYEKGLRSLGPVWSRPTIFGHGVPFAFPSSPDIGPGLTSAGKALIRECNRLGILIDLSHLNEAGFNDVAAISDAPLVATHSNAHSICPSSRNLTDRQLAMIRETKGMVGLNYAVGFLNADGSRDPDRGFDALLRHMDHLITHLGEDHVGLGSDFDGALIPNRMKDVVGVQDLLQTFASHGYDGPLLQKIAMDNWLRVLDRTWKN